MQVIKHKEAERGTGTHTQFTVRCSLMQLYQNDVLDMLDATGKPLQLQDIPGKGVQPKEVRQDVVVNGTLCF